MQTAPNVLSLEPRSLVAALCIVMVMGGGQSAVLGGTTGRQGQASTAQFRQGENTTTQARSTRNPAAQLKTAPNLLDAKALAEQLFAVTVTVRATAQASSRQSETLPDVDADGWPAGQTGKDVFVSTGVSLGEGLVIAFSSAPLQAEHRVTMPDGNQVTARLRVADYYSGLRLLEIAGQQLPAIGTASDPPKPGEAVLSASAAGIEQPVLALGMVSATERTLSGTGLPPLLQCSLPNTDTSSGAAVVNASGEMIGVVAVAGGGLGNDWTYVVPVAHALRLQTAFSESSGEELHAGEVIVLKNRRPLLGMTLEVGDAAGEVLVEHVDEQGPAFKAGLRPGMEVLSCEGIPTESVYAVVGIVLKKQPGDTLDFVVREGEQKRSVRLALEGGEVMEASKVDQVDGLHARNLRVGANSYEFVRPLSVDSAEPVPDELQQVMELVELLQRQKTLFAEYIDRLRKENEALRKENAELKKKLDKQTPGATPSRHRPPEM
ncbi:MAG: PDZ domain-containing protein [Pirellulales bacterium]|nr:PDZ domain-containing protein [Pirellulales bacterium]